MSIGKRLKYARDRVNLNGHQVRKRTGIGESSLSEFEKDKREPSLSQLQKLSETYRRSISFFLSDDPIPSEAVLWRKQPIEGAKEIEVHFLRLCEQYHNLEIWADDKPSVSLPLVKTNIQTFDYTDAEALARDFRETLQLGDRPGQVLLSVLEEVCGVKVFHLLFEPSGTAASTLSDTFGSAILLNSQNARWRRNHDLAHELFHLLTWHIFRSEDETVIFYEAGEHEEKLATCFARNLLMPPEATRIAVNKCLKDGKITYEALFDIARQFDVSIESLLWQLHFLYNKGPAKEEETKQEIEQTKSLAHLFEDRQQTEPQLWPERYKALAVKALRHGEISIGRFAEYLNISRNEAMSYIEREVEEYEEVQIAPA